MHLACLTIWLKFLRCSIGKRKMDHICAHDSAFLQDIYRYVASLSVYKSYLETVRELFQKMSNMR